ncbi:TIGR02221 family CRISPR-associated protein [Accumulibacter sp.]|jgi:CRISPR-associated Csx2 family protein|uniref:TIGR02221 family CRISPR-associated protein n=1 Tax=Accumulibacter sp. TaxID=2053492 RepID=UPI001AD5DDBB|nr:TIGR02221 family CRISPR-associated protein [Accumulibacter sp.]MBN8456182.1 TIGR02221 family CRISPR-associated protein [Accumulibacter sp.]
MTTLISFLGKGRLDAQRTGYQETTYRFSADFARSVAWFGLALAEHIKPQRLILVGTRGSMWDVFFERQGNDDDEVLRLMEATEREAVTQDLLDLPRQRLGRQLGIPVVCLLIPYARDTAEQVHILHDLAAVVPPGERLCLDLTHGFRHLPMLALVAARYLERVAGVEVEELYYGAYDMRNSAGETPVLRLRGLLTMLDWVDALATYDKDGDYGVFAPLLTADGMDQDRAERLADAAYYERTSNPVPAQKTLSGVFSAVEAHRGPLGALFGETLKKRIGWFRGAQREDWERSLAAAYLERRDYLRAATFLYEAFITRACKQQGLDDPDSFANRKHAYKAASKTTPELRQLVDLRNALAHGVRPHTAESERTLADEDRLRTRLRQLGKNLFPH